MKKIYLSIGLALVAALAYATETTVVAVGGGSGVTPGAVMTVTHTGNTPTAATMKVPFTMQGAITSTNGLNVSAGGASITGTVALTGTTTLTGTVTNKGSMVITNGVSVSAGGASITGAVGVTGATTLTGALTNTGATYVSTTVDAGTGYKVAGVSGFSGVVTNLSTLSTNIMYYSGGIMTNAVVNP